MSNGFSDRCDVVAKWQAAIAAEQAENDCGRPEAIRIAMQRYPDLRAAYVEVVNARQRVEALLGQGYSLPAAVVQAEAENPHIKRGQITAGRYFADVSREAEANNGSPSFRRAVAVQMLRGLTRAEATAAVCRSRPDLRAEHVAAANRGRR